jgi:hypothetical protein
MKKTKQFNPIAMQKKSIFDQKSGASVLHELNPYFGERSKSDFTMRLPPFGSRNTRRGYREVLSVKAEIPR